MPSTFLALCTLSSNQRRQNKFLKMPRMKSRDAGLLKSSRFFYVHFKLLIFQLTSRQIFDVFVLGFRLSVKFLHRMTHLHAIIRTH